LFSLEKIRPVIAIAVMIMMEDTVIRMLAAEIKNTYEGHLY
jgi:hypothetical protein